MSGQYVDLKVRIPKTLKDLLDELAEDGYYGSGVNDVVRVILQDGVRQKFEESQNRYDGVARFRQSKQALGQKKPWPPPVQG